MKSFVFLFLLIWAPVASAQVTYVDANATGNSSGVDWANAFQDLTTALASTTQGEIWVAQGRYHPGQPGDPSSSTFLIPADVALYGGFNGTETSLNQRDPEANTTILDGDLRRNDVLSRYGDNATTVVTLVNGTSLNILDGFVIQGGRGGSVGGGLLINGGTAFVSKCVFEGNEVSQHGGGAAVLAASVTFTECIFSFNSAASGGGLYAADGGMTPMVSLDHCFFVANRALQQTTNDGDGGGLYAEAGISLTVTHGVFLANRAIPTIPLTMSVGGGLAAFGANVLVSHTLAQSNNGNLGGGIYCSGHLDGSHLVMTGNSVVDVNNLPGGRGGALWVGTATLEGCTIAGNYAEKTAGGIVIGGGTVRNSIVWGNTVAPPAPGETPPTTIQQQTVGNYSALYSDIEGILQTIPGEDPPNPADFPGCIDQDPMFADATVETFFPLQSTGLKDMRLAAGSPCIDAADNAGFTITSPAGDFSKNPRFHDDPATIDTGLGAAPIADMGAHEFGPWSNEFPTASFTQSINVVTLQVTDTSTSVNPPIRLRIWRFGDGDGSCVPKAQHHYSQNLARQVRLRVLDDAFIWDASTTQTVNPLDTQGPTVNFITPIDGDSIVGTINIEVAAQDNDIVSHVDIYQGVQLLATVLNAPYTTTWDTTLVPDGFYTLRARGHDAIGNITDKTITVHVVNDAPVITCLPGPVSLKAQLGETMQAGMQAIGLQPLNFTIVSGPTGMQIDPNTGLMSWTPTPSQLGTHPVVVRVTNASGQASANLTVKAIPRRYLVATYDRPGYQETFLDGISENGVISGSSQNSGNGVQGFLLDQQNNITNLQAPTFAWTFGNDVNDNGLVVGSVFNFTTWSYYSWQNGVFNVSSNYPVTVYIHQPEAVNSSGIQVGYGRGFGGYAPRHAFSTLPGGPVILPPLVNGPGFDNSAAYGINDLNDIVGTYSETGNNPQPARGFVYRHATGTSTPFDVPGAATTVLTGINNQGLMCGRFNDCGDYSFVTLTANPTGPDDFLPLRVPGAVNAPGANDISGSGVVVGTFDIYSSPRGFIATPVELYQHPNLGFARPGNAKLEVTGWLGTGNLGSIKLTGVPPQVSCYLVVGAASTPTSFLGGTVVPVPVLNVFNLVSDINGEVNLPNVLHGGGGPCSIFMQFVHILPGAPQNVGFSNAVEVQWKP